MHMKMPDGDGAKPYELLAVVIHAGCTVECGHDFTGEGWLLEFDEVIHFVAFGRDWIQKNESKF
jgi:hypothetical protein